MKQGARAKFLKLYESRGPDATLPALVKRAGAGMPAFRMWMRDQRFRSELLEADEQRMFEAREKMVRSLPAIVMNLCQIASIDDLRTNRSITAAKLIFEYLGVAGRPARHLNVSGDINIDTTSDKSDEELVSERDRILELLGNAKRVVAIEQAQ